MDAWVYLFSKFSHEALLFEALALFLGVGGYAVFYLIWKRKYGVAGKDVPSNIIKVYLAQLIADAHEMNIQLFGLLGRGEASGRMMTGLPVDTDALYSSGSSGSVSASGSASGIGTVSAGALSNDPETQEKLRELEKRLAEQAAALDSVLNEKMKIEEELAAAKARTQTGASAGSDAIPGADRTAPLQDRVKQLEAQLAEYAIIEDDLANLKRLQKENKTLKQQLAGAAGAPTPEWGGAVAAPAPAVEAAPAAPKKSTPMPIEAEGAPNIETEVLHDLHADTPAHAGDFESLVDVVEKNLAESAKSESVEESAAEKKTDEKTEEQLQADFEKMLNS